ncbi:ankyrin repeat domain-containing protein, partial [Campylobacter blaseri]
AKFDRAKFWEEFKKASFILTTTLLLTLLFTGCDNNKSKADFVITSDTNVSKVPGLSKYVTQEEVDSFAFRYWGIDSNYTKDIKPNLIPLRNLLKQKDTKKVLSYIKDNNLSIDITIQDGTTPLMYSSFYNDLNTSKELIKLGANIRAKDSYKLSPLAYAVENNSTLTAKLLLDSGVKFDELGYIQQYINSPLYGEIINIIVDGDNIEIIYENNWIKNIDAKYPSDAFIYIVSRNYIELAKMVLESGYKPQRLKEYPSGISELYIDDNSSIYYSVYSRLDNIPNHEPMLDLLLKYNVYGNELTKEQLKKAYDRCYKNYIDFLKTEKEFKSGKITLSMDPKLSLYRTIKYHKKHCSDNNSTFKGIKELLAWANDYEKNYNISGFLRANIDNPEKVIYKNSNNKINNKTTNKE